jgi:hypothetical protein
LLSSDEASPMFPFWELNCPLERGTFPNNN